MYSNLVSGIIIGVVVILTFVGLFMIIRICKKTESEDK
jgi:hypothetical protein